MKCIVVGLGIQGKKRLAIAGSEVVATVDPVAPGANYKTIEEAPPDSYDAALVCVPDNAKLSIVEFLLSNGKHVLVEKPMLAEKSDDLLRLKQLASTRKVACYTAYNHRFEPHIVSMKRVLDSGRLGPVYIAKFFYGNGTARDVRNSSWRDHGMGVLSDLGSHLLDWTLFLFGKPEAKPEVWRKNCFENRAPDHCHFGFNGRMALDYEVTLLSWRNTLRLDIYGEQGSAHIEGLCKWGPSILTVRKRILPSGRPGEEINTMDGPDPTWKEEYDHFKRWCQTGKSNLDNDIWINSILQQLQNSP